MASLKENIESVVVAIRNKFNNIQPKLVPSGGNVGQVLSKQSNVDNDVAWVDSQAVGGVDESYTIAMSIIFGGKEI